MPHILAAGLLAFMVCSLFYFMFEERKMIHYFIDTDEKLKKNSIIGGRVLKAKKERVLTFAFGLFHEIDHRSFKDLSHSMGIEKSTLVKIVSSLNVKGYVEKRYETGRDYLVLTEKGEQELKEINEELYHLFFTPKRHGIRNSMKLMEVMDRIQDQFMSIFLYSLYLKRKDFDLLHALQSIDILQDETSIINIVEKSSFIDDIYERPSFMDVFLDTAVLGLKDANHDESKYRTRYSIKFDLIEAEVYLKNGRFKLAEKTYDKIIRLKNIPHEIW
ncbi:MAG: MarR family winged helix-turn-helix transcriptional regulator, partial [Thermoplasmatota archaeon]